MCVCVCVCVCVYFSVVVFSFLFCACFVFKRNKQFKKNSKYINKIIKKKPLNDNSFSRKFYLKTNVY